MKRSVTADHRRQFLAFTMAAAFAGIFAAPPATQTLIVASNAEHQAVLVDPTSYQVIVKLPTGKGPHEIATSPDGRFAYVANTGTGPQGERGNTITVLDLKKRVVKSTYELGSYSQPHDLRVSRDGSLLWAACAPAKTVLEIQTATGKIVRSWDINQEGGWMLAVTPDDRKIYTANLEGKSVSVIDRASNKVHSIAFNGGQIGIDVSPGGREVWVSDLEKNQVAVIDAASDRVIATFDSGGRGPVRVKFTPDGKLVLVPNSESKNVAVFDAASRRLLAAIAVTATPKVIAVSRDGRRAFVTNPAADQMTVIDIVARKETGTFPVARRPDGIAWAN